MPPAITDERVPALWHGSMEALCDIGPQLRRLKPGTSVYCELIRKRNPPTYWHTAFHGTDYAGFLGILAVGEIGISPGQLRRVKGKPLVYVSPRYEVATTYPLTGRGEYIFDYMHVFGREMNLKFVAHVACHWKKPFNHQRKTGRKQWGLQIKMALFCKAFRSLR